MKWLKRKQAAISPRADALAVKIAGRIIRKQTRIAGYLNRKTQYWNKASKTTALCLFCLLFGGISLYFILKSFFN
jgi:hypothetical protein